MSERLDEIIKSRDHEAFEKEFGDVQAFGMAPLKTEGGAYMTDPKMTPIQPNGFYVLVEMVKVKNLSDGGVFVGDTKRQQDACDIGFVRAVGNTAFAKFPGCDPSGYPPSHPFYSMSPAQIWGIDIGDKVEYRRNEGKVSAIEGCELLRYIPDTQIIGKVL